MAGLDIKMTFAKVQSGGFSWIRVWKRLEAISVNGMENCGWKEHCLWIFVSTSCSQEGKALDMWYSKQNTLLGCDYGMNRCIKKWFVNY